LKEKMLVPQLRFSEFEEQWIMEEFRKIANKRKKRFNPKESDKNFPCIELECLSQETGILLKKFDSKYQKSIKNIFSKEDILFGKLRPYLRKFLKPDFDGVCSSEIWVLNGKKVINDYLYFLIQTDRFNYQVNQTSGSKMPRADWDYISQIKFNYPQSKEQQKIANFLTAIDNRIQTLEKKKTLLEQYKKGVMQKIFKQELRFKDEYGKAFPEWEEKKLGEVCSKKSSNISANKIGENFGEYIIYGASGVLKKVDFYKEENDYVSIIKDGAGVGRIVYCKGKSSVLGTMEIIKPNSKLNTYFLYCLLENVNFKKYITGSTIPHIYFKDYKKEKCNIPPLEEQTKIANFLSAIDISVELVTKKIEHTKTFKKGLLQQMFV